MDHLPNLTGIKTFHIDYASNRIIFGKYSNNGRVRQEKSLKDEYKKGVKQKIASHPFY